MTQARQQAPVAKPDQGGDPVLDLARAIARAMALTHHRADTLPEPANEN
ncbi:hypothetical protein [Paremcibacter congregatus]